MRKIARVVGLLGSGTGPCVRADRHAASPSAMGLSNLPPAAQAPVSAALRRDDAAAYHAALFGPLVHPDRMDSLLAAERNASAQPAGHSGVSRTSTRRGITQLRQEVT
jgi:hypothetical protein